MYEIEVTTYSHEKVTKKIINRDLAIAYFKAFTAAEDAQEVIMIDGLTGEVLFDYYTESGWYIFNGQTIEL